MKTKNVKLGFNDLHQGKVFYIAEPGHRILQGKVHGKLSRVSAPSFCTVSFNLHEHTPDFNRVMYDYDLKQLVDNVNCPETYAELAEGDSSIAPPSMRKYVAGFLTERGINSDIMVVPHQPIMDAKRCIFHFTDDDGPRIVNYPITRNHFCTEDFSMRIFSNIRQARVYARKMPALPLGEYESIIDEITE